MNACAILPVALSLSSVLLAAEDIHTDVVFGADLSPKYKHPASITELANGDLYLAFYGGTGEYDLDTADYGARLPKGQTQWSRPVIIADTPFMSDGNPVIWQAPDGWVWLFYLTRYGDTWSNSRIKAKISKDGALTWSDPLILSFEEGLMVRSKPITLANGDYLLPIYHETGHDREIVGHDSTSLFMRYEPKTHRWTQSNRIRSRMGNIQPSVAQLSDNHLVCYCRRGGDYEPRKDGFVVRSESHDGGRTWSEGKDTTFPNPNAAVDILRLRNGHLLLVYNDSMNERTPLTVALSTDNDKTYPYRRNIATEPFDYAYPYAIQTQDDKIHVIYTSHSRTVINHAVFTEDAIRQGK